MADEATQKEEKAPIDERFNLIVLLKSSEEYRKGINDNPKTFDDVHNNFKLQLKAAGLMYNDMIAGYNKRAKEMGMDDFEIVDEGKKRKDELAKAAEFMANEALPEYKEFYESQLKAIGDDEFDITFEVDKDSHQYPHNIVADIKVINKRTNEVAFEDNVTFQEGSWPTSTDEKIPASFCYEALRRIRDTKFLFWLQDIQLI